MASSVSQQRKRSSAGKKNINSTFIGNRQRSSIGSQLPEEFFDYLDQEKTTPNRGDHLLHRFGKRLFGRFRNRQPLRFIQSSITLPDSEIESAKDIPPKRAFSLQSIKSIIGNYQNSEANSSTKLVNSSEKSSRNKQSKVAFLGLLTERSVSSDDIPVIGGEIVVVELKKDNKGFGFNIVGGVDDEHIPGDPGIFVSRIKKNSAASREKNLKEGDRIISINGIPLAGKTHNDAVRILRSVENVAILMIEQGAELRALNKPTNFSGTSSSDESVSSLRNKKKSFASKNRKKIQNSSSVSSALDMSQVMSEAVEVVEQQNNTLVNEVSYPTASPVSPVDNHDVVNGNVSPEAEKSLHEVESTEIEQTPIILSVSTASPLSPITASENTAKSFTTESSGIVLDEHGGDNEYGSNDDNEEVLVTIDNDNNDDVMSTASYDAHSVLDDVPRTPKRPYRLFDPSNASIYNELIYVTAGVAALGVGVYLGYQFLKRRSIL